MWIAYVGLQSIILKSFNGVMNGLFGTEHSCDGSQPNAAGAGGGETNLAMRSFCISLQWSRPEKIWESRPDVGGENPSQLLIYCSTGPGTSFQVPTMSTQKKPLRSLRKSQYTCLLKHLIDIQSTGTADERCRLSQGYCVVMCRWTVWISFLELLYAFPSRKERYHRDAYQKACQH